MLPVPGLRQEIAGKSILLEVRSSFHFSENLVLYFPFGNSSHVKSVNFDDKTNISLSSLSKYSSLHLPRNRTRTTN